MDNRAVLAVNDHDYGLTKVLKFSIKLEKGAQPLQSKVRPLHPVQEAGLKQQLEDWTNVKVIKKAISPWAVAQKFAHPNFLTSF